MPKDTINKAGRYFLLGLAIILCVIAADQFTKWYVVEMMLHTKGAPTGFSEWLMTKRVPEFYLGRRHEFSTLHLLPFLNFTMVWNPGVSFGILDGGNPMMPMFLTLFAVIVSLALLLMLWRARRKMIAIPVALVTGGALGNVADRLRFGQVSDFIDAHVGIHHWPAFNLADSCIVLGACLLLLDTFLNRNTPDLAKKDFA